MRLEGPQNDDGRYGLRHPGGQPLQHAGQQHQPIVGRQTAADAARQQQPHAARIGAPVAVTRQQPRRGQHGHGHGRHETGRGPLRTLLPEAEMVAEVGNGHVDDGGRHDRRHGAHHDRQQQQPPVRLAVPVFQTLQGVVRRGQTKYIANKLIYESGKRHLFIRK